MALVRLYVIIAPKGADNHCGLPRVGRSSATSARVVHPLHRTPGLLLWTLDVAKKCIYQTQ